MTPELNPNWPDRVRSYWESFWLSEMAALATPEKVPGLIRLFDAYAELEAARQEFNEDPRRLVTGSGRDGNKVLNPLLRYMDQLSTSILTLERQFGLTPKAAAQLGFELAAGAKTWAETRELEDRDVKDAINAKSRTVSALPVVAVGDVDP